jgi:hypothetical protein
LERPDLFNKKGEEQMNGLPEENPKFDKREWETMIARYNEITVPVNAHNREVLFAALAAAGIHTVDVEFNGCGDDGQIESITCFGGEGEMELPPTPLPTPLTIQVIDSMISFWLKINGDDKLVSIGDGKVTGKTAETLQSAIETVCYGCLEQTHGGWEIDEGSFGTFNFDVAKKTIKLDFNRRVEDVVEYQHEF